MQQHPIKSAPDALPLTKPTVARNFLETLAQNGVRVAFGVAGGLISPVYDALRDVHGIRLVSTRDETMAVYFAMGEYLATGVPALVLTTSGPGVTSVVTGLAAAMAEEIPAIVLGGEVPSTATSRAAFQDASTNSLDVVTMLRTVTRWSTRLERPAASRAVAQQALATATGDRPGPVFVSLPMDVARTDAAHRVEFSRSSGRRAAPSQAACRQIASDLLRARRPLIVAGNGARGASAELVDFARRARVPVVVTAHAKGVFPESDPLYLGVIGYGGHSAALSYLAEGPDVVCVVGSRLGELATNGWSLPLAGSKATYQIDRDPLFIGRNYPVDLGLVANAEDALALMASLTESTDPDDSGVHRIAQVSQLPRSPVPPHTSARGVHPGAALSALQAAFPDARWLSDIGEHCAHAVHHLRVEKPEDFRAMLGLAAMGSGMGAAMGLRRASKDRPVVAICGDGGFAMHAGELLTCVEHGIDVVLAVMNDGRWNMVDHGFRSVYGRVPEGLPARIANLVRVAEGFGALGLTVAGPGDLEPERLRELAFRGRPLVLDIRIDPTIALSPDSRSASLRKATFGGAS
jgi:acetolactate synthase-1/2/3 large subunit